MAIRHQIKRYLPALFVGFLLAVGITAPVKAETEDKVYPSISPVKNHVDLSKGDTYTGTFAVGNNGSETFNYKIYADPYQETDENGSVNYSERTNYTQIVDWITFDVKNGDVAPGETDTITYTINVPKDAPSGGQYAALVVEADNGNDNGGVQINVITRVASILYAQVEGETNRCAIIHDNNINTFTLKPPVIITSLVENCGNVDLEANYTLEVTPLFGGDALFDNEENPIKKDILPSTRRLNTISWTAEEGAPMIGVYNVKQTIKIHDQVHTSEQLVIIVPIWVLIIIALFIASLIFWIASRIHARKDAKRYTADTHHEAD